MIRKNGIIILLIAGLVFAMTSCQVTHEFDGSWSIETTRITGTYYGNGTVNVAFRYSYGGADFYEGSGTIGGTSYYVSVVFNSSSKLVDFGISLSSSSPDWVECGPDYYFGSPVSGSYYSWGSWTGTGDYTATKQ
jgi:hypothetical protein